MAILQGKNAASLCEEVIVRFTDTIQNFYNPNDLAKGYITTKNRHGIEEDFPFMSLSIVVVNSKHYDGTYQLSESMAALKKICKQKPGSNCVFG